MPLQHLCIYVSCDDRWFAKHCRITEFKMSRLSMNANETIYHCHIKFLSLKSLRKEHPKAQSQICLGYRSPSFTHLDDKSKVFGGSSKQRKSSRRRARIHIYGDVEDALWQCYKQVKRRGFNQWFYVTPKGERFGPNNGCSFWLILELGKSRVGVKWHIF